MSSLAEKQAMNQAFIESLSNPGQIKYATDAVKEFTRTMVREDGILREYMPALQVSPSDIVSIPGTDKPCVVVDKEPGSPAAVSVPYGTVPIRWYIRGDKYAVMFDRKHTSLFQKDKAELSTYKFDIRQVLFDNAIKDLLYEEDRAFLSGVETALGTVNTNVAWSGVPQWVSIAGGLTRDTWQTALSILPSTPSHLEADTIIMNNVTIREFARWDRVEAGGDLAERLLVDGFGRDIRWDGKKVIVTIKRNLVPDDRVIMLADPRFVGKFLTREDVTLHVEAKLWFIEFMAWEEVGCSIGHTGGLAIADFD